MVASSYNCSDVCFTKAARFCCLVPFLEWRCLFPPPLPVDPRFFVSFGAFGVFVFGAVVAALVAFVLEVLVLVLQLVRGLSNVPLVIQSTSQEKNVPEKANGFVSL